MNSGDYKAVINTQVVQYYGLTVCRAVAWNCGKFGVTSSGIDYDYTYVDKNSFVLRVGDSVKFVLSGLWVIKHLFPLFSLGTNVFCKGQKALSWKY